LEAFKFGVDLDDGSGGCFKVAACGAKHHKNGAEYT
jgi:hypothetical protein